MADKASIKVPPPVVTDENLADRELIGVTALEVAQETNVNGGAKLVHPGGAKLVHLMLCGTRCWGVVPVVHRRDPRCFE